MRDRWSQPAGYNLSLATLAFAVSFAVWSLLSPLAPMLQQEFHLSDLSVSVLIATPVLLGSLARIPMGMLTDRFGGRPVFSLLLAASAASAFVLPTATGLPLLLAYAFLLGLAGSSFAVGVPFVSRWFRPRDQGLALGIFGMGNVGTALAARLAPALAARGGWQLPFYVFGAVALATAALYAVTGRDAPGPPQRRSAGARWSVLQRGWGVWVLSLYYFLTFGGFVALGVYLPKFLVDGSGLSKLDAGNRTAVFVLLATVCRPLGGWLADRLGGRRVLTLVFAAVPVLAGVLSTGPDMALLSAAFLSLAACLGVGNGAVFKVVAQVFPGETGIVTGVVGAAGGLGGFFPPLVMGAVKQFSGSYAPGFGLLALFAAACLAVHVLAGRSLRPVAAAAEPGAPGAGGAAPPKS